MLMRAFTFEALSTSLLEEILLPAVVGDVTAIVLYLPERENLVLPNFSQGNIIKSFVRVEVDSAFGLALGENSCVLGHLVLGDHGSIEECRFIGQGSRGR
jgi:hypothetical protein